VQVLVVAEPGPPTLDMIVKPWRVLTAAQYQPELPDQPTYDEIQPTTVHYGQPGTLPGGTDESTINCGPVDAAPV
jgi:hypothetical protein